MVISKYQCCLVLDFERNLWFLYLFIYFGFKILKILKILILIS
jgi:hypothetical protein